MDWTGELDTLQSLCKGDNIVILCRGKAAHDNVVGLSIMISQEVQRLRHFLNIRLVAPSASNFAR